MAQSSASAPDKPVIVLTAFGTSVAEARKVFDHIDAVARKRYPGYEIRWAFTAQTIIDKLRQQGIVTQSLEDVMADLKAHNARSVVFQSLHVVPGQEFTQIARTAKGGMAWIPGLALMTSRQDIDEAIDAIAGDIQPGVPNVLVCHGNSNTAEYNDSLLIFTRRIQERFSNVIVASVEGQPGTAPLARARELAKAAGAVHFIPMMIVAGDHIENDVLGEGPDSWKSQVGAARTTVSRPLGYNDRVLEIYWRHLDKAIQQVHTEWAQRLGQAGADVEDERGPYGRWKAGLSFWPRRLMMLGELAMVIALGIFIGQMLDVSGLMRYLAVIAWPLLRLGRLTEQAGPAFLLAFQSGAMANTALVSARDSGRLNRRQLYTSVLVVSCLSLFAHLPTFIPAVLVAFGPEGTTALFAVRFGAIFAEVFMVLAVSGFVVYRWTDRPVVALAGAGGPALSAAANVAIPANTPHACAAAGAHGPACGADCPAASAAVHGAAPSMPAGSPPEGLPVGRPPKGFWARVWSRSRRTLLRLMVYMIPTFLVMSLLEYWHFFQWLAGAVPGLFSLPFMPPQAAVIIPAQAASLYNGAVAARIFLDEGLITIHQAVLVMLVGTVLTSPIRTLRHGLPTYVAVLGARPGLVLALSAQLLRVLFLVLGIWVLMTVWR